MTQYTYKEFADLKGVQVGTIYNAIRNGTVIADKENKTIDDTKPVNIRYLSKRRKSHFSSAQTMKKVEEYEKEKDSKSFTEYLAYREECKLLEDDNYLSFDDWRSDSIISDSSNKSIENDNELSADMFAQLELEKVKTAVELSKNRSEALAFKRAKELEIVVDVNTIKNKMQALSSIFSTELLSMPDTISDLIVDKVRSSDNPQLAVKLELKMRFKKLIEKVKQVTRETHNGSETIEYKLLDKK